MIRSRVRVTGVVQGVGFRPFVYGLAVQLQLAGFVGNDTQGVLIEVEGDSARIDAFLRELAQNPPPLAVVDSVEARPIDPLGESGFSIHASHSLAGESTPVPPDIATCADCVAELFDPANRRYRYPFLNCTNCGPRFTIIRGLPYDRPLTTMAAFPMCAACEREYHDPLDRRFHAQPTACPQCGPQLTFHPGGEKGDAALLAAQRLLAAGGIVAIKGIGGFHLACDAANDAAVAELRRRKGRAGKPFAVMVRDVEAARAFAHVDEEEARILAGRERPIVLLDRLPGVTGLSEAVAPGQAQLGLFLPYSPLHHLLIGDRALVMTSGNRSEEPIARNNDEALERLSGLADAFLLHDREIHVVCDDSVVRRELPIRRSRGYAPLPVRLPVGGPPVLAVGGELKAVFCLSKGSRAYLSQHIGDMENLETLKAFERALAQMRALFRVEPEVVVCDLHPGYLSSRWARECGLPLIEVQHHHAHAASLMAEHGLPVDSRIIAVAFDGTGLGTDGAIWGGEILLSSYGASERLGHLRYVPLPGGDASVKKPYRMALAHLHAAGIPWSDDLPCVAACPAAERRVLSRQLAIGLNSPDTSSFGRLFDAVASLLGIRHEVSYEAQGAMEMEALAARAESTEAYEFGIDDSLIFNPAPVWHGMIADLRSGLAPAVIAARFHAAVAQLIVRASVSARVRTGVNTVGLTGGVFQNVLLLRLARTGLAREGFAVLTHRIVPPNDGGIALGQAVTAMQRLSEKSTGQSLS